MAETGNQGRFGASRHLVLVIGGGTLASSSPAMGTRG
jgi:hypothetical protein